MNAKAVWLLAKDAGSQFMEDKAPRLGAALAYFTIFSLAPLLVIVIAIAGLVFGREAIAGQLAAQMQNLVGEQGAKAIEDMVASASKPQSGAIATIIGVAMLLFGAMGLFGQLQDAMDTIWEVQPKAGRGIMGFLRDRLLSFSMVLGTAFLLLVSLVITAALAALSAIFGNWQAGLIGQAVNVLVSFAVAYAAHETRYRRFSRRKESSKPKRLMKRSVFAATRWNHASLLCLDSADLHCRRCRLCPAK